MNLLSLLRLGIDLGLFPEATRALTDRLFIEAQPGHVQAAARHELDSGQRDALRADNIRTEFASIARPDFSLHQKS
jgi:protein arginine kinase